MKKPYRTCIFIIVILSSFITQANVFQQLTSGDMNQFKKAAQSMTAGQENTRQNTDIIAELLSQKYENALITEVDALSWGCKALAASSDGRYFTLLKKIADSNAHQKLRKYAKKSYKNLPEETSEPFKSGVINLINLKENETIRASKAKPIIPKASLTSKERLLFAIAKGNLKTIKAVAKAIYKEENVDRDVADVLSQYLLERHTTSASFNVDALAWICRAFAEIGDGRYTQVMEVVSENANNKRIRSYARDAYNNLPKAQSSYIKGDVVLENIVNKYKA